MRIIGLTTVLQNTLYVVVENIVSMCQPNSDDQHTMITFVNHYDGCCFEVLESIEEIKQKIREAEVL